MAGVGLRTVQTIQMTSRYSHLSQDAELDALSRLSDYQQRMKSGTDTRTAPNKEAEGEAA